MKHIILIVFLAFLFVGEAYSAKSFSETISPWFNYISWEHDLRLSTPNKVEMKTYIPQDDDIQILYIDLINRGYTSLGAYMYISRTFDSYQARE